MTDDVVGECSKCGAWEPIQPLGPNGEWLCYGCYSGDKVKLPIRRTGRRVIRFTLDIEFDVDKDPAADMWASNEMAHALGEHLGRPNDQDPFNVSMTCTDVTDMTEVEACDAVFNDRVDRGIGIEIAHREPGTPTRRYRSDNPKREWYDPPIIPKKEDK